eukprot:TRINITY_DN17500_c0_g1_i1.p1 TRINITY_DN17500_c0_g1~~TRINITY_DN17500_c0_g1_i1.p1  ORF type:complete len:913 (-),score=87.39 TRINITY_DN17500_c0_g1_i1:125-2863(-)
MPPTMSASSGNSESVIAMRSAHAVEEQAAPRPSLARTSTGPPKKDGGGADSERPDREKGRGIARVHFLETSFTDDESSSVTDRSVTSSTGSSTRHRQDGTTVISSEKCQIVIGDVKRRSPVRRAAEEPVARPSPPPPPPPDPKPDEMSSLERRLREICAEFNIAVPEPPAHPHSHLERDGDALPDHSGSSRGPSSRHSPSPKRTRSSSCDSPPPPPPFRPRHPAACAAVVACLSTFTATAAFAALLVARHGRTVPPAYRAPDQQVPVRERPVTQPLPTASPPPARASSDPPANQPETLESDTDSEKGFNYHSSIRISDEEGFRRQAILLREGRARHKFIEGFTVELDHLQEKWLFELAAQRAAAATPQPKAPLVPPLAISNSPRASPGRQTPQPPSQRPRAATPPAVASPVTGRASLKGLSRPLTPTPRTTGPQSPPQASPRKPISSATTPKIAVNPVPKQSPRMSTSPQPLAPRSSPVKPRPQQTPSPQPPSTTKQQATDSRWAYCRTPPPPPQVQALWKKPASPTRPVKPDSPKRTASPTLSQKSEGKTALRSMLAAPTPRLSPEMALLKRLVSASQQHREEDVRKLLVCAEKLVVSCAETDNSSEINTVQQAERLGFMQSVLQESTLWNTWMKWDAFTTQRQLDLLNTAETLERSMVESEESTARETIVHLLLRFPVQPKGQSPQKLLQSPSLSSVGSPTVGHDPPAHLATRKLVTTPRAAVATDQTVDAIEEYKRTHTLPPQPPSIASTVSTAKKSHGTAVTSSSPRCLTPRSVMSHDSGTQSTPVRGPVKGVTGRPSAAKSDLSPRGVPLRVTPATPRQHVAATPAHPTVGARRPAVGASKERQRSTTPQPTVPMPMTLCGAVAPQPALMQSYSMPQVLRSLSPPPAYAYPMNLRSTSPNYLGGARG